MNMKHNILKKNLKTLGVLEAKLITNLASQDKTIFTVADARQITKGSDQATRLILSGLEKKKWLIRLVQGKYLIVPLSAGEKGEFSGNWQVIAKHLIDPAPYYISYYSALELYEMTTQPIYSVYISSPIRRTQKSILGATYRFINVPKSAMWGIEAFWIEPTAATPHQSVKVSDLERTIIDCLDRPELCGGISEISKGIWKKRNDIDFEKLVRYSEKFGRNTVIKRLGFLLENFELVDANILDSLREAINSSYALVDSSLPKGGKYIRAWRLQINIDPKELIELTKT